MFANFQGLFFDRQFVPTSARQTADQLRQPSGPSLLEVRRERRPDSAMASVQKTGNSTSGDEDATTKDDENADDENKQTVPDCPEGRYVFEQVLGSGSSARVWKGYDKKEQIHVAIKGSGVL